MRPKAPSSHAPSQLLLGAIVVGLLLRLGWMGYAAPEPVRSDAAIYYGLATRLLETGHYAEVRGGRLVPHAYFLPGYPVFLAAAMSVNKSFVWISLVNVAASTLLIPILFLFVGRLFPEHPGVSMWAAWLCALSPNFVSFAPMVSSENLFATLCYSAVLLMITRDELTVARAAAAGLVMGFACLTRGEGLFYVPCLLLAGFLMTSVSVEGSSRRRWLVLGIVPAMVVAVLLPWGLRNLAVVGRATLSTTMGLNFYLAHNDTSYGWQPYPDLVTMLEEASTQRRIRLEYGSPAAGDFFFQEGLTYLRDSLRERPERLVDDLTKGILHLYRPSRSMSGSHQWPWASWLNVLAWSCILLLALLSTYRWHRVGWRGLKVLLSMLGMNWLCYGVVFWASPRYRFTIEPAILSLAAVSLTWIVAERRVAGAGRFGSSACDCVAGSLIPGRRAKHPS